jgi:hypothetical protein
MPSRPFPVYVWPPVGKEVAQLTITPLTPELELDEPELELDEPELEADPDEPEPELAPPELDVDEPEPEPEPCPELDADCPASPLQAPVEPEEHAASAATNASGRRRRRICTEIGSKGAVATTQGDSLTHAGI